MFAPLLVAAALTSAAPAQAGAPIGVAVDTGFTIAGAAVALSDIPAAQVVNLSALRHHYTITDPLGRLVGTADVTAKFYGSIELTAQAWTETGLYEVRSEDSSGFMLVVAG